MISTLPNGARGFDANSPIDGTTAHKLIDKGFQFAIRYVKRTQAHDYDLSHEERDNILASGLGLMVVQHVAVEDWFPFGTLGTLYGRTAAQETLACGISLGTMLWLDLEGVNVGAKKKDVIEYCNNWHTEVWAAGYQPGLYVGWHAGLTGEELYWKLKFRHYWGAYNLNVDNKPTVRGLQMQQIAAKQSDLVDGFTKENLDVDIIHADAKGETPMLMFR